MKAKLQSRYADLLEFDSYWQYKGFRASEGQRSVPMEAGRETIAMIGIIDVFRDAHPGKVYLDEKGQRWEVVGYETGPQANGSLKSFLRHLKSIKVDRRFTGTVTRGDFEDQFLPVDLTTAPPGRAAHLPRTGSFESGLWEFQRRFLGYAEIALSSQAKVRSVDVADIQSVADFPLEEPIVFQTHGWRWKFGAKHVPAPLTASEDFHDFFDRLLAPFLASAVEASLTDLHVYCDLGTGTLSVLDAASGGSGLAGQLLEGAFVPRALATCARVLHEEARRGAHHLHDYLVQLCHVETLPPLVAVARFLHSLASAWGGGGKQAGGGPPSRTPTPPGAPAPGTATGALVDLVTDLPPADLGPSRPHEETRGKPGAKARAKATGKTRAKARSKTRTKARSKTSIKTKGPLPVSKLLESYPSPFSSGRAPSPSPSPSPPPSNLARPRSRRPPPSRRDQSPSLARPVQSRPSPSRSTPLTPSRAHILEVLRGAGWISVPELIRRMGIVAAGWKHTLQDNLNHLIRARQVSLRRTRGRKTIRLA